MTKAEVEKQVRALPEEDQVDLAYSVLEDNVALLLPPEREEERLEELL